MKTLLILSFLLPAMIFAQSNKTGTLVIRKQPTAEVEPFSEELNINEFGEQAMTIVEDMPEFPGGKEALSVYLGKNIKHPAKAKSEGISGKVYVQFVVKKNGTLSNFRILKGEHLSLNSEALRVVKNMPKWKPGKQGGKRVNVSYVIPIEFSLK